MSTYEKTQKIIKVNKIHKILWLPYCAFTLSIYYWPSKPLLHFQFIYKIQFLLKELCVLAASVAVTVDWMHLPTVVNINPKGHQMTFKDSTIDGCNAQIHFCKWLQH